MTASGRRLREILTPSLLALLIITAMSAGCAERSFDALRPGIEDRGHYIDGVPFYRQGDDECGPAALAAVSSYWGRPADVETIASAVYLPKLRGTLPMDMEQYLRSEGFKTESSSGTLDGLRAAIRRNLPVITLLDLGISVYRQPHYVTVVGFDDTNRLIVMHDGVEPNKTVGYDRFLKEWARAGNWMVVARPGAAIKN